MEVKLQLAVVLLLLWGSVATRTQVTLMEGETLRLTCPASGADGNPVEWRNPEGFLMFFNHSRVLKDKRYSVTERSESLSSVSVSNVSFKDGGHYTCTHYGHPPTERKVEVTVISGPRLSVTKHKGKLWIKCSAQANASPPLLSWKLHGTEFSTAATYFQQEKKKHESESIIKLKAPQARLTVHCLLRHPALNSQPLMNFVSVGLEGERCDSAASGSSASGSSASGSSTSSSSASSSSSSTSSAATPPPSSTTGPPSSDSASTWPGPSQPPPDPQHRSTRGWASGSETTESVPTRNDTAGNHTGSSDHQGAVRDSRLLVFLVTCLIAGLLVVLLFLAIKLRRAHATWRADNDERDASEDSNKSKSSQEDKNIQRRRGLQNPTLTQYVVQEPTVLVPELHAAAQTTTDPPHLNPPPGPEAQTTARTDIKETSL